MPTCTACNNIGFITFTKYINEYCFNDVKLPISYVAYCDKCENGKQYIYDGTKCEKNKSKYYTLPISAYGLEVKH